MPPYNRDKDASSATTTAPVKESVEDDVKLPDMITYEPAIEIVKTDDVAALKNAPESFKEFFVAAIKKDAAAINTESQDNCYTMYSVNKIYKQKYASGGIGAGGDCVGGAAVLWGVVDGNWKEISGTQNTGFACEALRKHQVPSEIAGTICIDPYSEEVEQSYSQE